MGDQTLDDPLDRHPTKEGPRQPEMGETGSKEVKTKAALLEVKVEHATNGKKTCYTGRLVATRSSMFFLILDL